MTIKHRFRDRCAAFNRDEGGAVLIYVTLVIFILFGMVGLAIDGSRFMYLNSNMKQVADAAALAAAKELDGAADAITRATKAATDSTSAGYVDNHPETAWATDSQPTVEIESVSVCSALNTPGQNCVTTTDPKLAVYVRVVTKSRRLGLSFIGAVTGASTANSRAEATAKSSYSLCGTLQSFMCNPWEDTTSADWGRASNWPSYVTPGKMVFLTDGTGAASGNWGLLDPETIDPTLTGTLKQKYEKFWASNAPAVCTESPTLANNFLKVDTGSKVKFAEPGINVRFDSPIGTGDLSLMAPLPIDGLTAGTFGGDCISKVSATPNTSTGIAFSQPASATDSSYANYCKATTNGSCPFPRDRSFTTVTRTTATSNNWKSMQIGSGPNPLDLDAYWKNHHGGTIITGGTIDPDRNTRWKIYNYELNNPVTWLTSSVEPTVKACSSSTTTTDPYRRVFNVGIVDCKYWSINGASDKIPIATLVAKFFVTEPAVRSPVAEQGKTYGELIDTYSVNSPGGIVYQNVQLVR